MKKIVILRVLSSFLVLALLSGFPSYVSAEEEGTAALAGNAPASDSGIVVAARSAVLMDAETGTVLFAQNANEALPPASVTKVMTLLLIAEAIDEGRLTLQEPVTVSARAAAMGGSQIFLEAGEQMPLEDLFKSVVMASANDAACALAEHLCGSEEAFVARMNERAAELGMTETHFENTNGLDDTTEHHVTSAMDIAVMSRALLSHEFVEKYTTIWMDSVRDGAFTLTNTNRLVRFYPGCTGLKTGSTEKAKFCISASARRNGLHLVAVIMGAESRDKRNEEAKKLLDYGFATYSFYRDEGKELDPVPVLHGTEDDCRVRYQPWCAVLDKTKAGKVTVEYVMDPGVTAPVKEGERVGKVIYRIGEEVLWEAEITAAEDVSASGPVSLFFRLLAVFVGG